MSNTLQEQFYLRFNITLRILYLFNRSVKFKYITMNYLIKIESPNIWLIFKRVLLTKKCY